MEGFYTMRFIIGFFLVALLITGISAKAELSLTPVAAKPLIGRAQAITRARLITGLSTQPIADAACGLATDTTIPFVSVEKRLVWQITFFEVRITVAGGKKRQVNPHLLALTVLLDANSGALLRAETVVQADRIFVNQMGASLRLLTSYPQPRGITMLHRRDIEHIATGNERWMPTAARPALSLLKVLAAADLTKNTSQIQAFFGLYTDTRDPKHPIHQRPAWLLVFDGILLYPSGPPGSDHTPRPANQMEILDARTGENIGGTYLTAQAFQAFLLDGVIKTGDPDRPLLTVYLYNGSDQPLTFTKAQIGDQKGIQLIEADITPVQPILTGSAIEEHIQVKTALTRTDTYLLLTEMHGNIFSVPLITVPAQITCTDIEWVDPRTLQLTLEDVSQNDIRFTTVDVLPIPTKIAKFSSNPTSIITPKQPVRIALTFADAPAYGSTLWVSLKDGKSQIIASCLVTIPAKVENQHR